MAQNLSSQKKLAARILKCGISRIWIDPARLADAAEAITSADIRNLYKTGVIRKLPKKGVSRFRKAKRLEQRMKGRRKGIGSRKGKKGAKLPRKRIWIRTIRALRSLLKEKKPFMEKAAYKDIYRKAGSGFFRSRAHIMVYIERNKLLRDKNVQKKA